MLICRFLSGRKDNPKGYGLIALKNINTSFLFDTVILFYSPFPQNDSK
jgi:hypothetical protein